MSIDLSFRPKSYADFDDPVALTLNGIKGQMRREMVRDMLEAEGEKREAYDLVLGPIEEEVLFERASHAFVSNLNLTRGPSWLGGEFLPDLEEREVEIARVVLASTTMDVISLRARMIDGGYAYRMVNEYPESGGYAVTPEHSAHTLTLGELITLLDGVRWLDEPDSGVHRLVDAQWWFMLEYYPDELETCTDFARVESEQYPQLAAYYEERARQWRIDRARERMETCTRCGGTYDPREGGCGCREEVR